MQEPKSINQEILSLEKKYWSAMVADDYDQISGLTDFPCVVAGAQGSHAFEEKEFKQMFESGAGKIRNFEIDEKSVDVRQVAPDTAIIAYNVKSTFEQEGKERTIEAVDTSTWVKRHGKWVCALHTETELAH